MSLEQHHGGWVILVSFILGFMLGVLPLPVWATAWRPEWVAMVLIYWCIALPQRVGVATGWLVGLVHDIFSETLLGQHAFSFCLLAYLSVKFHRQIRLFPWWQQTLSVWVLIIIELLPTVAIRAILGNPIEEWIFIYPAFTSLLLWRWIFIILRDARRTYKVV